MARIRNVKPELWTDEKFVALSAMARLLFIGLWNFADREGRMIYSPKRIKMQIFPADVVEVEHLADELVNLGMVTIYEASNARILQVTNFKKHQHVNPKELPSLLPSKAAVPTNASREAENIPAPVQNIPEHSGTIPAPAGIGSGSGSGKEVGGKERPPSPASPELPDPIHQFVSSRVCEELGIGHVWTRRAIADVAKINLSGGRDPTELADRMVKSFRACESKKGKRPDPETFFGKGKWLEWDTNVIAKPRKSIAELIAEQEA